MDSDLKTTGTKPQRRSGGRRGAFYLCPSVSICGQAVPLKTTRLVAALLPWVHLRPSVVLIRDENGASRQPLGRCSRGERVDEFHQRTHIVIVGLPVMRLGPVLGAAVELDRIVPDSIGGVRLILTHELQSQG